MRCSSCTKLSRYVSSEPDGCAGTSSGRTHLNELLVGCVPLAPASGKSATSIRSVVSASVCVCKCSNPIDSARLPTSTTAFALNFDAAPPTACTDNGAAAPSPSGGMRGVFRPVFPPKSIDSPYPTHQCKHSTGARSRPRNGGELPANTAPLTSFMPVPPTFTSQ